MKRAMRRARWLAEWRNSEIRPVFYHCVSRVVERRFAFGPEEKEKFRTLMRVYERFSGCRVAAYCVMSNHFHLLLEVPPVRPGGISDVELLKRLGALYKPAAVAAVAAEIAEARKAGAELRIAEIHARFTYRMHSLAEFMKGLLQRFTQWFNSRHSRTGTLWEDRFKSVIVEDGFAAKTMAAYIDLNPVRAGICSDPVDYRWSSYGEAVCGTRVSGGKTARAGLVRALRAHLGVSADASLWTRDVSTEYRKILMAGAVEKSTVRIGKDGQPETRILRRGAKPEASSGSRDAALIPPARALRLRIRYFCNGAIIGTKSFVETAFDESRQRFGPKRTSGARLLRGSAAAFSPCLWSARDLRLDIT